MAYGDKPNTTISASHGVPQGPEILSLNFICDNDQLHTYVCRRTVNQLCKANVRCLSNIDDSPVPGRVATELKSESGFTDTRWPLNVKVINGAFAEI